MIPIALQNMGNNKANLSRHLQPGVGLARSLEVDKMMEQFQKTNEEILSPLIDEHIKRIYQYVEYENNLS